MPVSTPTLPQIVLATLKIFCEKLLCAEFGKRHILLPCQGLTDCLTWYSESSLVLSNVDDVPSMVSSQLLSYSIQPLETLTHPIPPSHLNHFLHLPSGMLYSPVVILHSYDLITAPLSYLIIVERPCARYISTCVFSINSLF